MTEYVPHNYQKVGKRFCLDNEVGALFWDPGLGKSVEILSVIKELKQRTLIIAPLDVIYRTWPREILKWDFSKSIKFTILHGKDKEANFRKNCGIYLINPDGLPWLEKTVIKHKRWPFKILVVDESTTFKGHRSKRFDILASIIENFDRRYILTGTPIPRSYLDLWSQIYLLDKGLRLGKSFYQFRNRFFYQADYKGWSWVLLPGSEEDIQIRLSDITFRVSGKDHLDLPEVVVNDVYVDMPKSAWKKYKSMAVELLAELDSGHITTAANQAVKAGKLQTIANGFTYISKTLLTGKSIRIGEETIHEAKLDALESLVNELNGNPLLVGYHYKYDLKLLLSRFPNTPHFSTEATEKQKFLIEKHWNEGKIPLLFAQIQKTALGLNLQESGYHIAYFSLTWNYLHYDQFIQRVARQGQKSKRVFVHRLIARGTIDEKVIIPTLKMREFTQNEFLDAMKQHAIRVIG